MFQFEPNKLNCKKISFELLKVFKVGSLFFKSTFVVLKLKTVVSISN